MYDETYERLSRNNGRACPEQSSKVAGYSVVIPKERLTSVERWELVSFDSPQEGKQLEIQANALAAGAEMENVRRQAHDEGYAQGIEAGYAAGIRQARIEAEQIHMLLQSLHEALNRVDEQLAKSLLGLALEIGRKMTGEVLQTKPELILKIASDAISSLPHFNQNAHLILHPDDADLVRKQMGEQLLHSGWKIFTDARIGRGGCRVETAHSHVDATVEARWRRIVESLGQDKSWLP